MLLGASILAVTRWSRLRESAMSNIRHRDDKMRPQIEIGVVCSPSLAMAGQRVVAALRRIIEIVPIAVIDTRQPSRSPILNNLPETGVYKTFNRRNTIIKQIFKPGL